MARHDLVAVVPQLEEPGAGARREAHAQDEVVPDAALERDGPRVARPGMEHQPLRARADLELRRAAAPGRVALQYQRVALARPRRGIAGVEPCAPAEVVLGA